jgi:signal peptidase
MHRRPVVLLVLAVLVGAVGLFAAQSGRHLYVVRTGSMSPAIAPGDAVLDVAGYPHQQLRRGQVVTFRLADGALVTHRVHAVRGDVVTTKGDANRTADPWTVAPDQVIGTVRHTLPRMGYALVYLHQPAGVGSLVTSMLGLFFAWQLFFGGGARPTEQSRRRAGQAALALG